MLRALVSLAILTVTSPQKPALLTLGSPLLERGPSSLTQRADGTPNCEGLVEEAGDRDRLPPWAMGWLMPSGYFVSVFRFNTFEQARSCAAGTEFVIRRWDRRSGSWEKP